jgi:hypothetical protein
MIKRELNFTKKIFLKEKINLSVKLLIMHKIKKIKLSM